LSLAHQGFFVPVFYNAASTPMSAASLELGELWQIDARNWWEVLRQGGMESKEERRQKHSVSSHRTAWKFWSLDPSCLSFFAGWPVLAPLAASLS